MAFYKKPITPYDPIQKDGQDGGAIRYFRDDFDKTGQNSHDTPPSQDAGQWMALTNVMPVSKGNIDRRWGYFSLSNLGLSTPVVLAPKHIYSYQRDTDGLRKLIICTTQPTAGRLNTLAIGEDGSIFALPITTAPTALPNSAPRAIVSRSTIYFYAGVNGSNLKWDGAMSPPIFPDTTASAIHVTKWGIDVNDVAASSSGPNLGGTASSLTGAATPWVNPTNIKLDDGAYTTATIPATDVTNGTPTNTLEVTNFALAASGKIAGLQVDLKGHFTVTGVDTVITRPTAAGIYQFSGFSSPSLAMDGNPGTSSSATVGDQDFLNLDAGEQWFGFPVYSGPTAVSIALKLSTQLRIGVGCSGSGITQYSLDNGATWTDIYHVTTTRGLTIDTIALPLGQDLTAVRVNASVHFSAGPPHGTCAISVIDTWIEVTNNTSTSVSPSVSVQLVKNGQAYGEVKSFAMTSATDTIFTLGGTTDLWGGSWSSAEIDLSNFGVHVTAAVQLDPSQVVSSVVVSLDYAKVTTFITGAGVTIGATSAGSVILTIGRIYYEAFKNSITGHPSDLSFPSASTGPLASKQQALTLSTNNDTQVDTKLLLATADGGDPSVLYLVAEMPNSQTAYTDNVPEDTLLLNQQYLFTDDFGNDFGIANNTPPPLGTLATKHKGRLWMALDQLLYFSKSVSELTLPNGFTAGRYEEAWPATNYFDISPGAESVTGLLSDGDVLYIATARHIRRLFGDDPSNFQEPEIVHQEAGVLNQEVWVPIFMQGTPSGTMWLTPDNRVIVSDFNTYRDAGEPIQNILDTINPSAALNAHATFYSQGPYDVYVLAIPTGTNTYCDTHLAFDLRSQQWMVWKPTDPSSAFLFNVTNEGKTQWLFTTVATSSSDAAYVYQYSSTVTQDQVGKTGTTGPQTAPNVGVDYETVAQTSWLDLGFPTFRKLLNEVEFVGDPSLTLTVEGADTQSDFESPDIVVQDASPLLDPAGRLRVSLAGQRTRKRYYRFTFKSSGPSQDMLDSYTVYVIPLSTI